MTPATNLVHSVLPSPVGPLTVVRTPDGVCGLYMAVTKRPLRAEDLGPRDDAAFDDVRAQLAAYFAGELREFDLPLDLHGTEFQRRVWERLLAVPYAQTATYQQLALDLGDANAVRAVGTANGSNPVSIIVPCHRVIGSDGSLTGYAGGLGRKRFLLDLETRVAGATPTLF